MAFTVLYLTGALNSTLDFASFTQEFCVQALFAVAPEYREISTGVLLFFASERFHTRHALYLLWVFKVVCFFF